MKSFTRIIFRACLVASLCAGADGCHSNKRPDVDSASGEIARGDVARNTQVARTETDNAYKSIQQNDYPAAEAALKRALAADPMYGPAHNNMGMVEFQADHLYEAAWQFQNAAKLMPHQPEPLNNLGLVLEKAGKLDEAEKAYVSASAIDSESSEFAANLARVRVREGKLDQETRRLLEIVSFRDHRPEWVDWARAQLIRLPATEPGSYPLPTTQPASSR